ncbi:hypothetical protein [Mesorhizobium sp. M1163]|uniref:hypothetical protein n=1 Tax=Mesorhizobium sp. M1163 TaxID=2957065 RepID=UPI00333C8855
METAFDQIERQGTPVDYSAELGRIVQSLTTLGERLKGRRAIPRSAAGRRALCPRS